MQTAVQQRCTRAHAWAHRQAFCGRAVGVPARPQACKRPEQRGGTPPQRPACSALASTGATGNVRRRLLQQLALSGLAVAALMITARRTVGYTGFLEKLIPSGMAWRSHGSSNDTLVEHLAHNGLIESERVKEAFLQIDRGLFVPAGFGDPSQDSPQPIGHGATISAPHMHAHCIELLRDHLKPGNRALDIGAGSGFLTCVMAHLVGIEGYARGIEHIPELVRQSHQSMDQWLARNPSSEVAHMWRTGRLVLEEGDGRADSIGDGPYHAIHVGAAAESIPDNLTRCLAKPGRMVVPVGPEGGPQTLMVVDKSETGAITTKKAMGVIYVPLCDKAHQTGRRTFI